MRPTEVRTLSMGTFRYSKHLHCGDRREAAVSAGSRIWLREKVKTFIEPIDLVDIHGLLQLPEPGAERHLLLVGYWMLEESRFPSSGSLVL